MAQAAAPIAPPSAPASGVTIVDTPPPAPPPPPTSTIHVSAMPGSADPPKLSKSPAMDRLRADLGKRAKGPPAAETPEPAKPATPESPEAPPPGTPAEETPGSPSPEPGTPPGQPPEGKAGKTNPWKLVETYKSRISEMEKQIAEAKTNPLGEQARKEYLDRIAEMEKANKELADEIRFVNYTKHPEFQEKYQKPYEAAWKRAVSELSEISLIDEQTNQARSASAEDLLALVNLPLGKAREIANKTFGEFADDVMAHRKEIRNLFEQQQQALENERKAGADREKQRHEQLTQAQSQMQDVIKKTWERENAEILKHEKFGQFFAPVDGDDEGNTRLQKGYALVDKAFAANPLDPKLTPEQRVEAVRLHAAVRNRAAAFGRLTGRISKLETEKAALEKELQQFKSSTPPAGGQPASGQQPAAPASARDSIFSALRAKAH